MQQVAEDAADQTDTGDLAAEIAAAATLLAELGGVVPEDLNDAPQALLRHLIAYDAAAAVLPPDLRPYRLLKPPEAAIYLALTPRALAWHRAAKSGPAYYRIGPHMIGYTLDDLDRWRNARLVRPQRPARQPGRPFKFEQGSAESHLEDAAHQGPSGLQRAGGNTVSCAKAR